MFEGDLIQVALLVEQVILVECLVLVHANSMVQFFELLDLGQVEGVWVVLLELKDAHGIHVFGKGRLLGMDLVRHLRLVCRLILITYLELFVFDDFGRRFLLEDDRFPADLGVFAGFDPYAPADVVEWMTNIHDIDGFWRERRPRDFRRAVLFRDCLANGILLVIVIGDESLSLKSLP